jgi:hypothetical protein
MAILQIRQAQREGARLVIGLAGQSGSGKTYTAIKLAYGMVGGNGSKVGFLDSENRRGSLYSDIVKTPFLIGDLIAPFTPARYAEAIREFQAAGVEVLIIDTISHVWDSTGGCLEIVDASPNKMIGWANAKSQHKRMLNTLLQCDMHIIVCIRAAEKTDFTDTKKPKYLGIQPICEKGFMFEMTASLMMEDRGRRQVQIEGVTKMPSDLLPILGRMEGYITEEDGAALAAWVNGAKITDPVVEFHRNALISITEKGTTSLKEAWTETPAKVRKALGQDFLETLKEAALSFETIGKQAAPASVDRFNSTTEDKPDEADDLDGVF